ncbi:oxygenase MpaB family protein [Polyangium sp. 15x6]|uniref:oxygenase MpaB family protein n=1 Tax=Polyangium sp. 15x6 TaxID=3042687 RepID=UPI00249A0016|nr:oxygenase MpaB family protein [Polyangium sp. 15x6]MDI3282304.1 oxygenase MpaB family protein [Polyangium sp. 15x6]
MTVTRADLERCLDLAKSSVVEPRMGLFGPTSRTWHIAREGVVFLAGGAAALQQLAHPFVAYGVAEHSVTREDTFGRFLRTFENVYAMIFGPLDRAIRSARAVHTIHERVTGVITETAGTWSAGTRYKANDEGALRWVFTTLIINAVRAYELVIDPLEEHEKDEYYAESRRFALLFGLEEEDLPDSYAAFERSFDDTIRSGSIVVTAPARELAEYLLAPPHPALGLAWRWYTMMTASLLPEALREGFGLPFGPREHARVDASIHAIRRAYPRIPARVRHVPAYTAAERRLASGENYVREPDTGRPFLLKLLLRMSRAAVL